MSSRIGDPLRVLLIVHDLYPGAPSVPLDAFEWMKADVIVHTVALRGGFLEARYRRLGGVDIVPAWDLPLHQRLRRRWFLRRLRRKLAAFRPHLLYLNSVNSLHPASQLRLPDAPALLHVHELESYVDAVVAASGPLLREWPSRYVAVSEPVRSLLVKDAGIPEEKVGLVHSFIQDGVLSTTGGEAGAGARKDSRAFVVGGAGFPSWRKGITLWLQIAAALRRLAPALRAEFRWVGMVDNPEARAATLEAKKLGVDGMVKFVPRTEGPLDQYREFDAFAMTSWEDPCPLVVLENMALGKPVLCFAGSGGAPDEIGDCGVIVPEFCPEMMASAIVDLAGDPARREALGQEARRRVGRQFVASVQGPRLLDEMRRAAGLHPSGS